MSDVGRSDRAILIAEDALTKAEKIFAAQDHSCIAVRLVLGRMYCQGPGKVAIGVRLEMIGGDSPLLVAAGRA